MYLAVLSNDQLNPWINWSTLGPPLLRALANKENAVLVSPPPLRSANAAEWLRVVRRARQADTVFWMQGSARPELPLWLLSAVIPRARRAAFVVDAWKPAIGKIGLLAAAQRLNPCFVAFREGYEELVRRFPGTRFEWLPFGVDIDNFKAGPGERDVFAYWMGRQYEPLHRSLAKYCEDRGLVYRCSRGGEIGDPVKLGRLVGRSRYFVVTPPDLGNPQRTGGFSPLVMRYLEGLSAGARLLGVLPRSGEYELLLPRDALLEVAPDGSDLAQKLDTDAGNSAAWSAVERACELVRTQHSWSQRAERIWACLAGQELKPLVWPAIGSASCGSDVTCNTPA